jgi:hypothetical protein
MNNKARFENVLRPFAVFNSDTMNDEQLCHFRANFVQLRVGESFPDHEKLSFPKLGEEKKDITEKPKMSIIICSHETAIRLYFGSKELFLSRVWFLAILLRTLLLHQTNTSL